MSSLLARCDRYCSASGSRLSGELRKWAALARIAAQREGVCLRRFFIMFGESLCAGQLDDACRCIGEAMTTAEATKERWCEADIHRIAGEIALKSPEPDAARAEAYFQRALAGLRVRGRQSPGNCARR